MPIDFGQLQHPKAMKRPVDPIELFQSVRVTDTAINDLWLAQGDALREWHKNREVEDVLIQLNTGAGKTLVGLLAAQSLVNETNGHVVYACSSVQLVEQTASKARGYGLETTTYFRQSFNNELYQQGLAPCITTYHALINGRSRFYQDELSAIIFDDAHAAEHLFRDQFTLRIERQKQPGLFTQIAQLFRSYYTRIGLDVSYTETQQQLDVNKFLFVPPFALREQLSEVQRLLLSTNLQQRVETMFAWEYLKDHLDLCTLFISGQDISFTPAIVPVKTLSYFQQGVRRLYLSATLTAGDGFLRTFGKLPDQIIAPATTAGECERLILIPSLNKAHVDDVRLAQAIIAEHKALVLVPSYHRAAQWQDPAAIQQSNDVTEQIENFKQASAPDKLLLVSRYDGVDLPGDTCRIVVIDDLPSSLGPLERYFWQKLNLGKGLRSTIASRIVQSFGRISRGMSDHGVVILTGKKLIEWLLTPKNRMTLPQFLRRQLELGIALSKQDIALTDLVEAPSQCLKRDPGWLQYYQSYMDQPDDTAEFPSEQETTEVAAVEVAFGHALWLRDYERAAKCLEQALDKTFQISSSAGAWHALWLGYCYELMDDQAAAETHYHRAHGAVKNIPAYAPSLSSMPTQSLPVQVLEVTRYLQNTSQLRREVLQQVDAELALLDGMGSVAQTEEALRALGEYLGLDASRPDNEFGTGPDVLWEMPGGPALSLEAKTEKGEKAFYQKKDLGQLRDHFQWVQEHTESSDIYSAFVGPLVPASPDSNPGPEITVIELNEFRNIAEQLRAALLDIFEQAVPITLAQVVLEVFKQRNLLWPDLYLHINKHKLSEITAREEKA